MLKFHCISWPIWTQWSLQSTGRSCFPNSNLPEVTQGWGVAVTPRAPCLPLLPPWRPALERPGLGNLGDNIWNGRAVVTMPTMDSMKVLIYAQETEYKRIEVGDSVEYTFDAMPANRAWGRVTRLSPMGLKRTEGSEVKTFEVEATVDSLLQPLDPGLSVNCRIFLQHVPDTLVVPTVCVYKRDSVDVVYVRKGRKYEEREVRLSISTPRSSVIAEGVSEGEQITLIKPDDKHIL